MASTAVIVSSVVGAIVVIAIVIIIIIKTCGLSKLRKATNSNRQRSISLQNQTKGQEAIVEIEPMEQFIDEILRERPMRYTSEQIMSITDNFSNEIGKGGFGVVYKGKFPNGLEVAVKVLKVMLNRRAEEQFMAEIATVGRTYHMNLVKLYGFCFDKNTKALIYEYMANGALDKYLFEKKTKLNQQWLHEIAVGTAKGIRYLHEECQQKIVHYDIKPANVLLSPDFVPKVADFGLAMYCERRSISRGSNSSNSTNSSSSSSSSLVKKLPGRRGTPGYAAPELWLAQPVTSKCDVYSFGMLLFEILGRRRNLEPDMTVESQEWFPKWAWQKFEEGKIETIVQKCAMDAPEIKEKAERMCKVALWCVQFEPEARPTMSGVVRMLEGDIEIVPPVNPFVYLMRSEYNSTPWSVSLSSRGYMSSMTSKGIKEDSERVSSLDERSMLDEDVP